ncbi:MAG: hypothetical protein IK997_06395, partial [Bacilli bacterium]|nr:hypothetical protein [Bacilli bacterium]
MVDKYMEEVVKVNEDPDFHQYMSWEEDQRKIQNSIRKQFREEGLAEGRKEGIKEGIKEGRAEANLEAAKKMIEKGYSLDEVSDITGLSIDKLNNL